MTLTELANHLAQLFPNKAPSRLQLEKALKQRKFHADKVPLSPNNPLSSRCVWQVPDTEVQKIITITREHIEKGTSLS